ncbi:MAG: chain-length determining protein [Bacteroidales bacterium]|nr:chain-length determining protein [Bacteroidales bacterium]
MKGENKNCNAVDDGDIKIDVMTTIKKIWDLRKTLIKIGIITFVISCVIVLLIPKKYSTMVTLAPEAGQNGEGMLSGVASMLGMGGLNIGEDADALNVDLYPDIVSSTPFMLDILDTQVKMLDNPQEEILLVEYLENHTGSILGKIVALPIKGIKALKEMISDEDEDVRYHEYQITKDQLTHIKTLRKKIITYVSNKTGVTNIEVTTEDPLVTAILTDTVVTKLKEKIINYRIAKVAQDCQYWEHIYEERKADYHAKQDEYARYVDSNKNIVLQSAKAEEERLQNEALLAYQLYSNVATQLQLVRAKVQEAKPAFAVVEPAIVPLKAAGLGRSLTVIVMVLVTEIVAILWLLWGKGLWQQLRVFLKQNIEEEETEKR